MEAFTVRDLSFAYPEQKNDTLSQLSFPIPQGQFVTLCGPSGCGKSTLLRQLKTVLAPAGYRRGEILFEGTPLNEVDQRTQSSRIGFVLQSPDNQIVTDKVWHELAFGLESLGYDTPAIHSRVAEMASLRPVSIQQNRVRRFSIPFLRRSRRSRRYFLYRVDRCSRRFFCLRVRRTAGSKTLFGQTGRFRYDSF